MQRSRCSSEVLDKKNLSTVLSVVKKVDFVLSCLYPHMSQALKTTDIFMKVS